ncbi:MAG: bifunctional hydroxymethylpyrimidine kinase/phosphomethylpyrimidine kinase [Selenomonadaceae bacterium]|nr:bifunctional hydroxymethylpyrimidine kinase/phosphomethylpyrimidine kinase [Selenomonadaceae bacterium]
MNKTDWQNFFTNKVNTCDILVIGDIMMDKYYYGDVRKFASDAPVPVAKIVKRRTSLGAAANIANNLANLGCRTSVAGFVGDDHNFETLSKQLQDNGINQDGLIKTQWPTTTKVRIMSGHVQMFRMDFEDLAPHSEEQFTALENFVERRLNDSLDAIILADYEKGVCTERFCGSVIRMAHNHGVPVIVMPYGQQWIKYSQADYIAPNVAKINQILLEPIKTDDDEAAERAGRYIMRKFKIKNVLATRSASGITLVMNDNVFHLPTRVQEVFDSAGAGDTVTAIFTAALAGGLKPIDGAYIANLAAGIVLRKSGTYAITLDDVLTELAS